MKPVKRRQQFAVGLKIRELRKERRLTQSQLAARIGIQQSDLCRMETGEYKVSLDTLFRILGVFGMQIGEFFSDTTSVPEPNEDQLLLLWRHLDEPSRREVLDFLRFKSQQEPTP